MFYEGRIQKLISLSSAQTSVYFNKKLQELFNDNDLPFGIFDARVMQFPNNEEAINCLLFRQRDHIRNSISGYAQFYFSHKEIDKKNSDEKIEMMKEKGFNWNKLDKSLNWSKFGTFLWKENIQIMPSLSSEPYIRTAILSQSNEFDKCIDYILNLDKQYIKGYSEEDWLAYKEENR
jgi:tRNA(His) 5'-end guanylyltransferase